MARDDLRDGGANHFARTITAVREMDPSVIVEVLVPDFHAQDSCIRTVLDAAPDIYNHNMETVERLTPLVRSRAKYRTSLHVLRRAKELSSSSCRIVTKSGVMLGLGEKETELFQTMDDLREVGCEVLTMGQICAPPPNTCRWWSTSRLTNSIITAISHAKRVFSCRLGPLVRSSYHAADFIRWFADTEAARDQLTNSFDGRRGHPGVSRGKTYWRYCPPNAPPTRSCAGSR